MTYEEQLKDRRWWLTRKVILIRDEHKCTRCGSPNNLQVHHLYYTSGKLAWEYPFEALTTLCKKCHDVTHGKLTYHSRSGQTQSICMALIDMVENQLNQIKNG